MALATICFQFQLFQSVRAVDNHNGSCSAINNHHHKLLQTVQFWATRPRPRPILFSSSKRRSCYAALSSVLAGEEEKQKVGINGEEAALLVDKLRKTYKSGRTKTYQWRISQLSAILKMLDDKQNQIIAALYKDLSRPDFESYAAEISTVKSTCKLALKDLKDWMRPEEVETPIATFPSSAEIVSESLGLALVISTWNYPFFLSVDPIIGAIAAGNTVVLKPSEIAPSTSSLLSSLFEEYLDKSAVKVVEGAVPETTALLEQKWDIIFYTGSARVGRIVMAAAAKHLTPVVLELGGKCPAVVDSDVDLQVTVRRIIAGKWQLNNGQACIGVDHVITTKDFAPKLINAIKTGLEECFGKNPMTSKDISSIVNAYHYKRLERLLDEDQVRNKIVLGGQRDQNNLKIAPTVLLDVPEDSEIMQDEIFGPLLPIITVKNMKDSLDVINSKPKPLAAYLFSNSEQLKNDFVQNVSSGGMVINDTMLHVTVLTLPFGGVGESGMGQYHGKFSFDAFSHKKAVLYRSFNGDSSLRYPPYTSGKQKLLKALLDGGIFGIILALFELMGGSKD